VTHVICEVFVYIQFIHLCKIYDSYVDALDAHFNNLCLFRDAHMKGLSQDHRFITCTVIAPNKTCQF
jgi:hypothetical protein